MIRLKPVNNEGDSYVLFTGKTYTVGRRASDILLKDQTISKIHAELKVDHPQGNLVNPILHPILCVIDKGSKFGTFANDGVEFKLRLQSNEITNVAPDSLIKFGTGDSIFRVEYRRLVITPSQCKASPDFRKLILEMGGHICSEYQPATEFVLMKEINVTLKVVQALLSAKPIVTEQYFYDLKEALSSGSREPDPKAYLPPLAESNIPDPKVFYPVPTRSKLFEGKTFISLDTKTMMRYTPIIRAGGGQSKPVSAVSTTDSNQTDIVLLSSSSSQQLTGAALAFKRAYERAEKRIIGESEIGLAAIHNNVERYCNPYHDFQAAIFNPTSFSKSNADNDKSVVQETQSFCARTPGVPSTGPSMDRIPPTALEGNSSASAMSDSIFRSPIPSTKASVPANGLDSVIQVKNETVADISDCETQTLDSNSPSTANSSVRFQSSSLSQINKRPLEFEDSVSKRQKLNVDRSALNSPKRMRFGSYVSQNSMKKLKNLFNMSDSEDDEQETTSENRTLSLDVVPESPPRDGDEDKDISFGAVPESQSQNPIDNGGSVKVCQEKEINAGTQLSRPKRSFPLIEEQDKENESSSDERMEPVFKKPAMRLPTVDSSDYQKESIISLGESKNNSHVLRPDEPKIKSEPEVNYIPEVTVEYIDVDLTTSKISQLNIPQPSFSADPNSRNVKLFRKIWPVGMQTNFPTNVDNPKKVLSIAFDVITLGLTKDKYRVEDINNKPMIKNEDLNTFDESEQELDRSAIDQKEDVLRRRSTTNQARGSRALIRPSQASPEFAWSF